jgi:hypothetical protein
MKELLSQIRSEVEMSPHKELPLYQLKRKFATRTAGESVVGEIIMHAVQAGELRVRCIAHFSYISLPE